MGPWRFVHCRRHRLRPKDRLAPREPMCRISARFEHASIRSPPRGNASIMCSDRYSSGSWPFGQDFLYASTIAHGRHLSLSFYQPPSVGLLEQFLERNHARATSEFAGWRSTRTTGSVLRFRFSLWFCFCLVLHQVEISTILQFPDQYKPL